MTHRRGIKPPCYQTGECVCVGDKVAIQKTGEEAIVYSIYAASPIKKDSGKRGATRVLIRLIRQRVPAGQLMPRGVRDNHDFYAADLVLLEDPFE